MTAYYNEIDPFAAAWLRELIKAGHIAPGDVDTRSIEDVTPDDLRSYTQCHFFAGIGVWSRALRTAGWADDRPIWTGSCPCQPFSAAGKGTGFDDERHLWPAWFWLIEECRPAIIVGEQVASKDAEPWIDLVQDDLEALGYGVGAVPFPSASVGAPHIRDRLYWLANADQQIQGGRRVQRPGESDSAGTWSPRQRPAGLRPDGGLANSYSRQWDAGWVDPASFAGQTTERASSGKAFGTYGAAFDLDRRGRPGPVNGFWGDADWLFCRDGKWRPVEPSTFPLANGATARVGRLRGYGNAINAVQAQVFIEEVMALVDA